MHPAVEQAFLDRLTVDDTADDAVPSVVHWDQTVWLHTGTASYHPGNGRVRLRVKARDLQAHYALSDAALVHVLQVCAPVNSVLQESYYRCESYPPHVY